MSGKPWRMTYVETEEDCPPEARETWRGLQRWLDKRRARNVPETGLQDDYGNPHCAKGCKLHLHDE